MGVLLDTTVVSLAYRSAKSSALRKQFEQHLSGEDLWVSFQTVAELWVLPERNRWGATKREALEQFMHRFVVLPYDEPLGRTWGKVMAESANAGRRLESADAWIVATAIEYAVPLLSHDRDLADLPLLGLNVICYA